MPSIELLLDDDSDRAVRAEWSALAENGLPSQAAHQGASNAPHITAVFSHSALTPFPVPPPSEPVLLGAPLLFVRRRGVVLVRAVVATRALLEWHERLHHRLPEDAQIDRHTLPGAWTPHVTLARAMPTDRLADALAVLDWDHVEGRPVGLSGVRMWDSATRTLTSLSS